MNMKKSIPSRMTKEAIEARREYYRKWRQINKEKTRASQERYWNKRAKEEKEQA